MFGGAIEQSAVFGRSNLYSMVRFYPRLLREVTETARHLTGKFGTWFAAIKEKGDDTMEITITVSERDKRRIEQLGSKPWWQTTPQERMEYDKLVQLCGTAICMKILNK